MSTRVSMQDVTEAEALMTELLAMDISEDSIGVNVSELSYQGFDPSIIIACMSKRGKAAGHGAEEIKKNIQLLAIVGTLRGGNFPEIIKRSSIAIKEKLESLKKTYNIFSGPPKSNEDVTLLRLAAVLAPPIILSVSKGKLSLPTAVMPESLHDDFPKFMCNPNFGCLIPDDEDKLKKDHLKYITGAFAQHQRLFDRIINSKKGDYATKDRIKQFITIQIASKLVAPRSRTTKLTEIGLLAMSGSELAISPKYLAALKAAAEAWEMEG
ncbi:nucleocapsid protein [Ceraphron bunya-like virus]|uniref:Nucleoprotein n=1 Tax=Ceraphron bunya-like virus TaxID=2984168 RepID=A0A9N7AB81_9VIRU|nr:nucleocapsid protein [Ceraphron bunya-like virus]DAZ90965.1 TPA_asm: nucleocapsid protein [Ceraphron bunya-like virus]